MRRRIGVTTLALGVLLQVAQPAAAAPRTRESSYWGDAGYGALAVLSNILYMPAKAVYAGLGTITGGLAYVLTVGDTDTARKIWSPSLGGNYVITPQMLRGDEPILFNGPSYTDN